MTVTFKGRRYSLSGSAVAQIQQVYRDWEDAMTNGNESGRHQPVIFAVNKAGIPARGFKEAVKVARELS